MKNFVEVSDKLNFLLIDESDAVRVTLKQVLKNLGLKNIFAVSGVAEASQVMKSQKIDFVFCDRDLKDVSGMDFLKEIRENVSLERFPFMMMGYEITKEDIFLASEFGIDAYLKKPFVMKDIAAKLTVCIDKFNQLDSTEAKFEKARRLLISKNYKEAVQAYELIRPELPDSARLRVGIARCLKQLGDLNQAITLLNEAVVKNEYYVHAYHELGLIYVQLGKFNEALQNFRKAIDLSPKNPIRYELTVDIFLKWDLYSEAEELLLKAEKLELVYPNLHQQLAFVLNKQKKYDKALTFFQKSLKRNPDNVGLLESVAICMQEIGKFDEATSYYNQVLKRAPENMKALENKMICQIEVHQFDRALKTCQQILKLNSKHAGALSKLDALAKGIRPD